MLDVPVLVFSLPLPLGNGSGDPHDLGFSRTGSCAKAQQMCCHVRWLKPTAMKLVGRLNPTARKKIVLSSSFSLPLIQKSKLKLELKTLACLQNRRFLTKLTEALKYDDSSRLVIDFPKDPCEDVRASGDE